jgi:hypothetical protein
VIGAFDVDTLGVTEHRRAFDQPRGGCTEHHSTGRRHGFHPLRHSHLLTNRGVTQRTRAVLTGNHLPGIETHPQPQTHTVTAINLNGQPRGRILNTQRRQTGTKSVILQRVGRAKDRHDAVAGETVHRAAITLHRRRGAGDQCGHDLAPPLHTHRRGDIHGTHDVGEQHRDLLVLRRLSGRRDCRTALATELGFLAQFRAARSAQQPRGCHLRRPPHCCSRQYRVTRDCPINGGSDLGIG